MRVLFTVSAWPSHYFPMVPLGRALQSAGHEVRVVCAASQKDVVSQAGLTAVPLIEPPMDMLLQNRLWNFWAAQAGKWPHAQLPPHPVTGERMAGLSDFDFPAFRQQHKARNLRMAAENFDAVVNFARSWEPSLVVHDRLSLEGLLAARVLGIPACLHLWGPHGTAEPEPELRVVPGDPSRSFPRYGVGELNLDLIDHIIDPCPEGIRPPIGHAVRLPVSHVPYNGAGTAPQLPPGDRPRICLAWGNSLSRAFGRSAHILPELIDILAVPDTETLLLAGRADVPDPLPPGLVAREDCPLHLMLPDCAAVVHYGGAGCTMTAVHAGVPQLIIPYSDEQALNARRITEAGAGICVPGHMAHTPDFRTRIRAAVKDLLSQPSYSSASAVLRHQTLAAPSPAELVRTLEELAFAGSSPRAR